VHVVHLLFHAVDFLLIHVDFVFLRHSNNIVQLKSDMEADTVADDSSVFREI